MTTSNINTLVFFPHLYLRDVDEIDFGFLKIWNFSKRKDILIQDPTIKSQFTKILDTYQTLYGPIQDMGIVSINSASYFSPISQEQHELIREAKLILFLSFVARSNVRILNPNNGHRMATSENFQETYQNFKFGDDNVAEFGGYVVPFIHGGLKLGDFHRIQPGFIPTPFRFETDDGLLAGLLELRKKRPRDFKRIINAVELLFESYHNSESVSRNARILLQMSAFEILLKLPERAQRRHFKNKVEALSVIPEDKEYLYSFEFGPGRKRKEKRTRKGIWADRIYTLRNHIIHGGTPPDSEYYFSFRGGSPERHTDLAFRFFVLLLKKGIEKSLHKTMFSDDIVWEKWSDNNTMTEGEGFVYDPISFR